MNCTISAKNVIQSEINHAEFSINLVLISSEQELLLQHDGSSIDIIRAEIKGIISIYAIATKYSITKSRHLKNNLILDCLFSIIKSYNIA